MPVQLLDPDKQITVKDSELEDVSDGDPETTYTVRQIPPEVNRDITKRSTSHPPNRRTGSRETVVDHFAVFDDLLDYALIAWSGILDRGEPAPCERAYKMRLDVARKAALLSRAGVNEVVALQKAHSFRGPA